MGRGGAWRQEELKRFSSWVTTKVGLPRRAVGPSLAGWGSRCNIGLLPVGGSTSPAFSLAPQALFRVQMPDAGEFTRPLISWFPPPIPTLRTLSKDLTEVSHLLWGLHSMLEKLAGRGPIRGTTERTPL